MDKLIALLLIVLIGIYFFSFFKKILIVLLLIKLLSLFISSSGDSSNIKLGQFLPSSSGIKIKDTFKQIVNKVL